MNFTRKKPSAALKFIILQITSLLLFANVFSQENYVSCTITNKLITIKNANTTLRINNDIQFEMFFEKDGMNSRVTKENNKSSSVFLSDPNNNKISFTRKSAQVHDVNNKFGKGKTVKVVGASSDGRLICSIILGAYRQFPNVIMVQSSFKNISKRIYFFEN